MIVGPVTQNQKNLIATGNWQNMQIVVVCPMHLNISGGSKKSVVLLYAETKDVAIVRWILHDFNTGGF